MSEYGLEINRKGDTVAGIRRIHKNNMKKPKPASPNISINRQGSSCNRQGIGAYQHDISDRRPVMSEETTGCTHDIQSQHRELLDYYAGIELQHIYLEVYAERYHSLRQYFEAYYCYRHGLVTRQNKPDWAQILPHAMPSEAARATGNLKLCVSELKLPLEVMVGKLKTLVRDDELSVAAIQHLLEQELAYVRITREEWKRLKDKGLLKAMPADYYRPDAQCYQDADSRFQRAAISFS